MAAGAERAWSAGNQRRRHSGGNRSGYDAVSIREAHQFVGRNLSGNNRSAGKSRSSHTTGGNRWLRGTLTECAWAAAAKKNCFLKDKFWRITTKSGGRK